MAQHSVARCIDTLNQAPAEIAWQFAYPPKAYRYCSTFGFLNKQTMQTQELMLKVALQAWQTQVKRAGDVLLGFTDEQLFEPVAPGRNRAVYLLGHLIAVNDGMLPLLGLGEKLYPALYTAFVASPDSPGTAIPPVAELRKNWEHMHAVLTERFASLTAEEWVLKHTAMSDADYEAQPERNRLSVLLNRTCHMAYHLGQVNLIKK